MTDTHYALLLLPAAFFAMAFVAAVFMGDDS